VRQHVCPWWIGFALASPLRRVFYTPRNVLEPYVRDGMLVLEPGPGMGFFTLELAVLVGKSGKVVAVDVQEEMLERLRLRAQKKGISDRIDIRLADANGLRIDDLAGRVDFILAFAMVHEVPDKQRFFSDLISTLRPEGCLLISEPAWHVRGTDFRATLETALGVGFRLHSTPTIKTNLSALLVRKSALEIGTRTNP
jgi:ubiquinone/menaquinone biosynthesis C-methylase UbiE